MPSITEGKLHFDFPENWQVTKYDDWVFYKNQFGKLQDGLKAIDILAIDTEYRPRKRLHKMYCVLKNCVWSCI